MDFINEQNKSKLLLQACLSWKSCGLTTLKNDKSYLFRQNADYISLVFTKTVHFFFRALWLATQSANILHYSLIHLRASDAKFA